MEGTAVLREVFATYEVRAVAPETPRVRNITSVPRRGARLVVR
jgi:cytochrome P450